MGIEKHIETESVEGIGKWIIIEKEIEKRIQTGVWKKMEKGWSHKVENKWKMKLEMGILAFHQTREETGSRGDGENRGFLETGGRAGPQPGPP